MNLYEKLELIKLRYKIKQKLNNFSAIQHSDYDDLKVKYFNKKYRFDSYPLNNTSRKYLKRINKSFDSLNILFTEKIFNKNKQANELLLVKLNEAFNILHIYNFDVMLIQLNENLIYYKLGDQEKLRKKVSSMITNDDGKFMTIKEINCGFSNIDDQLYRLTYKTMEDVKQILSNNSQIVEIKNESNDSQIDEISEENGKFHSRLKITL